MIIVPVCNWLSDMIGSSYLSQLRRYTIVNGIDLKVFRPSTDLSVLTKRYGLESKFVVLAVASNWNVTKGEFDIYHWARQVSDDVRFIMIGLNKTQIKKLPINILGFERTEDINQLVDFYSLADVFINPTYQDTFPTVNIEAMACGTPVIAYNTGGCKEMITDSIGFVIDRGDKVRFLESLNEVRMKPKGYYKESCRNRAVQLYNKDERYAEYLKLYYKILNYSL
ncbi:glycosyltransferase [Bacteroides fragilis]|nr:glycosyltransferase [Bacteroides fragilis]